DRVEPSGPPARTSRPATVTGGGVPGIDRRDRRLHRQPDREGVPMTITAPAPSRNSLAARVGEPEARFRDLLGAEWIKLWSLRSTYASLSLIIVSAIGFCVYASLADYRNWPSYGADHKSFFDPIRDAFPQQAYL